MTKQNKITVSFFLVCFLLVPQLLASTTKTYNQAEWDIWKKAYDSKIIGKGGWLSLAGLYWLSEGINTLGSAADNNHRFPDMAPGYIGSIEIHGEQLIFIAKDTSVLVNGIYQDQATISVSNKTLISFGQYNFYIIKREKGYAVRLIDNASEQVKAFAGTAFIPYNQSWVIKAKLISHKVPKTLSTPTVYGTIREEKSAGWLEFNVNGKKQRLEAVNYGKDTPMYVMFSDSSSGDTTYGAGRYIEVEWPDKNGITLINFNRAYSPPCAYTLFATCPLTPRQNRLSVNIKAGELYVK